MSSLATYFGRIVADLYRKVRLVGAPDRATADMLVLVAGYILRVSNRFERLHARWLAGTLPKPRPALPPTAPAAQSSPAAAARTPPARPRITRRKGWLRLAAGRDVGNFGTQILHMLLRPDMPAFLAAAPQAGRLLRPLLHLLNVDIPAELALPPRPPRKRPERPAPPPQAGPEPRWGKYSLREARRYRPGPIRTPSQLPDRA